MLEKMRKASGLRKADFYPTVYTKSAILSMIIIYSGVRTCEMIKKDEW